MSEALIDGSYEYALVEVKWLDAQAECGWEDHDKEYEIPPCTTVGFLIVETQEALVIASTYHDNQTNARMVIPSVWVRSKRELCSKV